MHFKKMKSLLRLPAIALCAALSISSASAHDTVISSNIPASDTSVASIGMISSNEQVAIGLVRTTEEMVRARDELAARQAAIEAEKAAIEAEKLAQEQAAIEAAIQASNPYIPNYDRVVTYSSAYTADQSITANGTALGNFKLTFYCACEKCSGGYGNNTATGTKCKEGRTIAVDPRVIPLGSEVFIEGFGSFIAEDTGGAIKQNKIDIYLSDHDRCYSLGVANANVYLMNK